MWNPRWRPGNGCDDRVMAKILAMTIQVLILVKTWRKQLPSQPFLGHYLGFHIWPPWGPHNFFIAGLDKHTDIYIDCT